MKSIGKTVGKRAAKATARHTWHGFTAKAKRKPLRSATVFTAGSAMGLVAGWLAARHVAGPAKSAS